MSEKVMKPVKAMWRRFKKVGVSLRWCARKLLVRKDTNVPCDEKPTTPRESDDPSPKGAISVEYAELTRLASYGDTLHTERTQFWVLTHTVLLVVLAAFVQHLSNWSCGILCALGGTLCFFWGVTARRISIRLNLLNKYIKNHHKGSPHAFWLRYGKPNSDESKKSGLLTTGRIFGWIVPAVFGLVYLALLSAKFLGWTEDAPFNGGTDPAELSSIVNGGDSVNESTNPDVLIGILDVFKSLLWPGVVLILVCVFRKSIKKVVRRLTMIKIGGVEFTLSELEKSWREREHLRIGIVIGCARSPKKLPMEIRALGHLANGMGPPPAHLDRSVTKRWLYDAYNLAVEDGKLAVTERKAIESLGMSYDWALDDVKEMVSDWESRRLKDDGNTPK